MILILSWLVWTIGAALVLSTLSYGSYLSAIGANSFRQVLGRSTVRMIAFLGLSLCAIGWAGLMPWWLALLLILVAATFVYLAFQSGQNEALRGQRLGRFRDWLSSGNADALGIIVLALLLALLYARIILPWMQPDEPRHFEVSQHVARLGTLVLTGDDRVVDWEREIIQSMEENSFWWYGFSMIGWDPNDLPDSFAEIWGARYSVAFFQGPLYYAFTGSLLRALDPQMPPAQALIFLRLVTVGLYVITLWGISRTLQELLPQRPQISVSLFALAALWPSHLAANTAVNNDVMAELIVVWALYFIVRLLRHGYSLGTLSWLIAFSLIAIYVKRTALIIPILFLAAVFLQLVSVQVQRRTRGRLLILAVALVAVLVILVVAAFLLFQNNYLGIPADFSQNLRDGRYLDFILSYPIRDQANAVGRTFMGWFGWMRVPLPEPVYWLGTALFVLSLAGLLRLIWYRAWRRLQTWQILSMLTFALAIVVQIGFIVGKQVLYADWSLDSIPQARYLFPVSPALFFFLGIGCLAWVPSRWHRFLLPATITLLLIFNAYVLGFVLYPFFWL